MKEKIKDVLLCYLLCSLGTANDAAVLWLEPFIVT
jgi:hypothetical protein